MKTFIKLTFSLCILFLMGSDVQAQKDSKWTELDKSPTDMIYYPANMAWRNYLDGEQRNARPKMKLIYSRPSKNDRDIFGGLVPYSKEWRLGANEATQITFYQAVEIDDQRIPRGTYTLFATPHQNHWIIDISKQTDLWGGKNRDKTLNVASVKAMTEMRKGITEQLSMAFRRVDNESAILVMEWDNIRAELPISFNPVNFEDMAVSPMDQVHYPSKSAYLNYLKEEEIEGSDKIVKVIYGRPQKKERKIFGELLKYGDLWRVGANQSTEVAFYKDVIISGNKIKKGTYNLYAFVNEKTWEIILNTDRPAWGAANRDEEKDVAKITLPVTEGKEDLEVLNIIFEEKSKTEVHMIIAWEKTRMHIPIQH